MWASETRASIVALILLLGFHPVPDAPTGDPAGDSPSNSVESLILSLVATLAQIMPLASQLQSKRSDTDAGNCHLGGGIQRRRRPHRLDAPAACADLPRPVGMGRRRSAG
ncbi:hypothetical protein CHELA40_20023 [Chelatococcus asaccharovorans]|nr:hypothetical protein CHELA17_10014 [Chelatococcus asaccharovorans]CAH1687203.1 hypothetical protein CHELA40_20023 [Chelatococcus asaccharovorans]